MDYQPPTLLSEANFLGHLIFGLVDATVDTTVCRGQILMENKKILSMDLLVETDEVEQGVRHRAARLYRFDRRKYDRLAKQGFELSI